MSKPMEEMRQIALQYEKSVPLATDEYSIPPTNKVMININTLFAAIEDYDIMCKVVFALEKVAKERRMSMPNDE
jgi:hypothetical protein